MTTLYGPDNRPITREQPETAGVRKTWASYISALHSLDGAPSIRAQQPLRHHAWVYIATMHRAITMSQAPLLLYRETPDTMQRRREAVTRAGGSWGGPCAGRKRSAVNRHLTRAGNPLRFMGLTSKALQPDYDHPVSQVLQRPNPAMSQSALLQIISVWLSLRGEAFLLGVNGEGEKILPGEIPEQLWPLPPDLLDEEVKNGQLRGWWLRTNDRIPRGLTGQRVWLDVHEVIQFKYPNPENPFRGITPISAAAAGIDMDLMTDQHNRSVIANGADPGGILTYDGDLDETEEQEFLNRWEDRNKGPQRSNRVNIVKGSWKYIQTGLTPRDMDHLESKRWNRETIMAIMRVPKSISGVTDDLNYATFRGQQKIFWDNGLLPDMRLIEDTLDYTLLFEETDDVVAGFELSGIEALREGLGDQIDKAIKLIKEARMPPEVAFQTVGFPEVPEFEGSDIALVPFNLTPVENVINPPEPAVPAQAESAPAIRTAKLYRKNLRQQWQSFVEAQTPIENLMRRTWRTWVNRERDLQLEHMNSVIRNVGIDTIMLPLAELQERIETGFTPSYQSALQASFTHLEGEYGDIGVFDLDDPVMRQVMETRVRIIRDGPPATLQRKLRTTILEGLDAGEGLNDLRERAGEVFRVAQSSPKALQVARTESANIMNAGREAVFDQQGFEEFQWVTAGDESVRDTHAFFGSLGKKPRGFNYLEADGYPGTGVGELTYPGDPAASTDETINCRCVKVPV